MSSERATGQEFVPQIGNPIFQLGNAAFVVQHAIGGGEPGLPARLGRDPARPPPVLSPLRSSNRRTWVS